MDNKLRIIVNNELSPGLQLAQAVHAARSFADKYPNIEQRWYEESNYLVVLSTNYTHLQSLTNNCDEQEIHHICFTDPDLGPKITALAIGPGREGRRLTSSLPLALKGL